MPWSLFASVAVEATDHGRTVSAFGLVALGLLAQALGMWVLVRPYGQREPPAAVRERPGPTGGPVVAGSPNLPELRLPIDGVGVPADPNLLPGARRDYRGGVHEGVDFNCAPGSPVHAALGGTVLWVNAEPDIPPAVRSRLLDRCRQLERTPSEVLNALHGKRVVIYAVLSGGQLLTTSYSHLGSLRGDIVPGQFVRAGEVIAWTGSTGTSHAARRGAWSELHFEVKLDGVRLGEGLTPREAGALYARLFKDRTR